eukprot:1158326-Pelagomonas_calceolata.AAC.4
MMKWPAHIGSGVRDGRLPIRAAMRQATAMLLNLPHCERDHTPEQTHLSRGSSCGCASSAARTMTREGRDGFVATGEDGRPKRCCKRCDGQLHIRELMGSTAAFAQTLTRPLRLRTLCSRRRGSWLGLGWALRERRAGFVAAAVNFWLEGPGSAAARMPLADSIAPKLWTEFKVLYSESRTESNSISSPFPNKCESSKKSFLCDNA